MPAFIAFCLASVLTPLTGRVATRFGLVDRPGDLKIHGSPVPVTGGVAVMIAMLGTVTWSGEIPAAFWIATVTALLLGTVDDAHPLPVATRFVGQVVVGTVVASALPGFPAPLVVLGGIVVVTSCANAVNMLDGQDALAGGLGAIAALSLAIGGGPGVPTSLAAIALAGALLGFLIWNRPPARIFLGNGGAYAVGVFLGAAAVSTVIRWGWSGLLGAGLCLGPFVFDLVFTVGRRLLGGGLVGGDRFHSYDLVALGMPRPAVTLRFYAAALASGCAGAFVTRLALVPAAVVALLFCAAGTFAAYKLWPAARNGHRQDPREITEKGTVRS